MTSSIVRGKYVVTRVTENETAEIVENGAVVQIDGKIVDIGSADDIMQRYRADEIIGDGSHVVLPGFVNGHHHSGLTPIQLGCPDLPLELWLPWRFGSRSYDPYLDTLYSAFEMIESGVTTVQHIGGALGSAEVCAYVAEEVLRAYRDVGMRVSYSFMFFDQNNLVYEDNETFAGTLPDELQSRVKDNLFTLMNVPADEQFQLFDSFHERHDTGLTRIQLAPANLHWNSDALLERFAYHSARLDVPMHMHLVETAYQKEYARRRTGSTAVQYLEKFNLLGKRMTIGHGTWLTEADIDLLAHTGTHVCHCPSSNLRLRSGIAPLNLMHRRGIEVALGIDEAGINDDRDMLQEMRLALNLHRRESGMDDNVPTHCQILRMATENGAMTTPFGAEIGALESGRSADLTLIRWQDIIRPYLDADVPVIRALLHRAKTAFVDTVIVDGTPILRDGRFTRVDKDAALEELARSMQGPPTPEDEVRRQLARDVYPHVAEFYRDYLN